MITIEEANKICDERGWETEDIYNIKEAGVKGIVLGVYDKHNNFHVFGRGNTFEEAVQCAIDIGIKTFPSDSWKKKVNKQNKKDNKCLV